MQKVTLSELDSGERVISERVAGVRSVALGFWIDVGSRDERAERAGVSHFIEHLLFKGSRRFDAQQIAETFDAMGAELNAATSRENTVVYARVPDHHVETALEVMTDMVFAPSFAEVDQEREVVLEEIAMYEDAPQELVHDLFSQAVFADHPLGRPVIGTAEVISTVSRRALSGYHRRAYAPGNVVVAAAGNVDHDRLVALLQRSERRAGAPARAGTRVRRPLAQLPGPGLRFQRKETEQYHLCLGATGISRSDRRRFASSLLDSILGGSASSRLFQEIREKRGMAYAVYSFGAQYTDTGILGVYVGTREENLAACVEICVEQIGEIEGQCAVSFGVGRRLASRRGRHRRGPAEGAFRQARFCRRLRRRHGAGLGTLDRGPRYRAHRARGGGSRTDRIRRRPCHGGRLFADGAAAGGVSRISRRPVSGRGRRAGCGGHLDLDAVSSPAAPVRAGARDRRGRPLRRGQSRTAAGLSGFEGGFRRCCGRRHVKLRLVGGDGRGWTPSLFVRWDATGRGTAGQPGAAASMWPESCARTTGRPNGSSWRSRMRPRKPLSGLDKVGCQDALSAVISPRLR